MLKSFKKAKKVIKTPFQLTLGIPKHALLSTAGDLISSEDRKGDRSGPGERIVLITELKI